MTLVYINFIMGKTVFPVVLLYGDALQCPDLRGGVWITENCPTLSKYKCSCHPKRAKCFSRPQMCHSKTMSWGCQGGSRDNSVFSLSVLLVQVWKASGRRFQPLPSACSVLATRALGQRAGCRGSEQTLPAPRQHRGSPPSELDSSAPRAPHTIACLAASALPKITFQLWKTATSGISSGNETHCRMKSTLHPAYSLLHYFLIAKLFFFLYIFIPLLLSAWRQVVEL